MFIMWNKLDGCACAW